MTELPKILVLEILDRAIELQASRVGYSCCSLRDAIRDLAPLTCNQDYEYSKVQLVHQYAAHSNALIDYAGFKDIENWRNLTREDKQALRLVRLRAFREAAAESYGEF